MALTALNPNKTMQCLECIRQNAINVTFDDLGGYMVKKVLMLEACNSVCII